MHTRQSRHAILAVALSVCCIWPDRAHAFDVTYSHGRSTNIALHQWAAQTGYSVIWQLQNAHGTVDFAAPAQEIHEDFRTAVEALVSGAAYGRQNVYCSPPLQFQAEALVDDRMRLVYVVGRPTGKRCVVPYP